MGAHIRKATLEDAEGINRCHVGGWKVHYRGILPDAYLDAIDYDERLAARKERLDKIAFPDMDDWVLVDGDAVLGWAAAGPTRDEDLDESTGELYAIYLDPDLVGQGHGRALMTHCIEDARSRGCTAMTMWVLTGNERARRFYEAAGFVADARRSEEPFHDMGVTKLRMVRSLGGDA